MKKIFFALCALAITGCSHHQSRMPSSANDDFMKYFEQAQRDKHELRISASQLIVCIDKEKNLAAAVHYYHGGGTFLVTYETGKPKEHVLYKWDQFKREFFYRLGDDKYYLKVNSGDRPSGYLALMGPEAMRTELDCAIWIDEYRGG